MAKIAYVDHSFHRKTLSTAFLPQILKEYGHSIDFFWDELWNGGAPINWNLVEKYDAVIMFQAFCPIGKQYYRELHPNVTFIPMLDQFGIWKGPLFNLTTFWEPFQGSKILSFSQAVHAIAIGAGIYSRCLRYYQPITEGASPDRKGLHGFFWIRRSNELPWETVRELIGEQKFDSLHLHLANDPGSPAPSLPTVKEIDYHNITTSTWYENKAEFLTVLERANVFFASRMEEGIGQSFLEAMARGQCVVAPNNGTMNEYILSGVNGLLYDPFRPQPLDLSSVNELGKTAKQSVAIGYEQWCKDITNIVDYILTPSESFYIGKYHHHFDYDKAGWSIRDVIRTYAQRHPFVRRILGK